MTTIRTAVGMLKGLRPGTGEGTDRRAIYEAIVLHPALNEICADASLAEMRIFPVRPTQPTG